MEKILLKDLKSRVFKRSALIPIMGLDEILNLNPDISGDEIFTEIVRVSLGTFEYHHPLIIDIPIFYQEDCEERQGYHKMVDNFNVYLDGRLDENQISLIPNSVNGVKVVGGYTTPGSYYRVTDYDRPYVQIAWSTGAYMVRSICNRPLIESYTPDKKLDDNAAIYYMSFSGVKGNIFINQVLCDVLDYIRSLKSNFILPNFPVDILSAADGAYQQKKMELDQYYLQSNWRGELIL